VMRYVEEITRAADLPALELRYEDGIAWIQ